MSVRIITDSASDITQSQAKEMDIDVLPLKIEFGEDEYLDGINISHMEFYEKLIESSELPKTSQLSPYDYGEAYDAVKEDDIILITLSSKLSGCYQSANVAAQDRDNVYIVDSLNVAIAQRALVDLAVRYRDEGLDGASIYEKLENDKKRLRIMALLGTLEYLKKGGRISATAAVAGEMLSIKPVVTVEEGIVVMLGKARGSKNGNNMLTNFIEKEGGIDFSMPYSAAFTGLSDKMINKYLEDCQELYKDHTDSIEVHTVGSAIGTHVGPGTIAVAFFINEK